MITYRRAHSDERTAYTRFADLVFARDADSGYFEKLLPKVYAPTCEAENIHYLAVDDELGIRGLVAALPTELHVLDKKLNTAYIGTVSVHPEARRQGHMIALMQRQMSDLRASGCDMALLSGQRQRYEHFGFVPGGERYCLRISTGNIRHVMKDVDVSEYSFEQILPESDAEQWANELLQRQQVWFSRDYAGYAVTSLSFNSIPYLILYQGKRVGTLQAHDQDHGIDEICLENEEQMEAVLKAWMQSMKIEWDITLTLPAWKRESILRISEWAENISYRWDNYVCILRYARVLQAYLTLKSRYTKLQDGVQAYNVDGQAFTVTVKDGKVSVTEGAENPLHLTHIQASKLFVMPFDYPDKPAAPANWYPLPIYVSRADEF